MQEVNSLEKGAKTVLGNTLSLLTDSTVFYRSQAKGSKTFRLVCGV